MSKFDFTKTISRVQAQYKKEKNEDMAKKIGLGNSLESISTDPNDYVVMPDWFKENYGVMGLKIGHMVQWAGKSDSGKTTLSLLAMKRAQEQGFGIIYVETEGKTGPEDLAAAGVDPDGVICVHSSITEEAFELGLRAWESFFTDYPDAKLLFVFDSFGNTTSLRDSGSSLTQDSQMVGGHAKTNRFGLSIMRAKMVKDPVSVLIVNRTIDNIGSPGKTNAGGDALNFFSMLTIQATRAGWYERTVNGEKVRAGADVYWVVYKNHYAKALKDAEGNTVMLPKSNKFRISGEGIQPLNSKE
jgi:recombination protein RecA